MILVQQHPEFAERLRRAREELRAWGVEPTLHHMREPFDYDRR